MAVENTRDGRRFDRSYLVFGRMAELSGRSIIIGHEAELKVGTKITPLHLEEDMLDMSQ